MAIAGIDTRRLTRMLRTQRRAERLHRGLAAGDAVDAARRSTRRWPRARAAPSMAGLDLAKVVSVDEPYDWTETEWQLGTRLRQAERAAASTSSPTTTASSATSCACWPSAAAASPWCRRRRPRPTCWRCKPDGIFLANGPGDPEPCDYAIEATRELIERGMPTFGICLGHQILALASGAKTFKMKFGHHGANHPVKDLDTGRVSITSQNHGFAVDEKTLPADAARHARRRCSTARCKGWRAPTSRRSASRATPRPRPGRTTSAICSIASSR